MTNRVMVIGIVAVFLLALGGLVYMYENSPKHTTDNSNPDAVTAAQRETKEQWSAKLNRALESMGATSINTGDEDNIDDNVYTFKKKQFIVTVPDDFQSDVDFVKDSCDEGAITDDAKNAKVITDGAHWYAVTMGDDPGDSGLAMFAKALDKEKIQSHMTSYCNIH